MSGVFVTVTTSPPSLLSELLPKYVAPLFDTVIVFLRIEGYVYLVIVNIKQLSEIAVFLLIPVSGEAFIWQDRVDDLGHCRIFLQKLIHSI